MKNIIQYEPWRPEFKSPLGSQVAGTKYTIQIGVCKEVFPYHVYLCIEQDQAALEKIEMQWCDRQADYEMYTAFLSTSKTGVYFYHFEIDIFGQYLTFGRNNLFEPEKESAIPYQVTAFSPDFGTPDWFKGGVMYQIFVDRFNRGNTSACQIATVCGNDTTCQNVNTISNENRHSHTSGQCCSSYRKWGEIPEYRAVNGVVRNDDFFGGDLYGVLEKLDYLQSIGVTTLYLCPIFEAASNHKYDTGNYMAVDKGFGGDQALTRLVEGVKARGMSIILDGVFNHTGDDSVYFNRKGRYEGVGAYQSKDSTYYDWYTFREYPDNYDCWWGIKILPALNENSTSYQEFVTGKAGVIEHWMQVGVDGFRLDVVDELPDFFVEKIRTAVHRIKPNGLVIGEVWEDASSKVSYGQRRHYFEGKELDSCMNYLFLNGILNYIQTGQEKSLLGMVRCVLEHYPKAVVDCLMNIVGTHDTVRLINALGVKEVPGTKSERSQYRLSETEWHRGVRLVKLATLLQFTLPGVPSIYYGDEVGLDGFEDPFNRRCYPWGQERGELLSWYTFLGELRKEPVFKTGFFQELYMGEGVFLFARRDKEHELFNRTVGKSDGSHNMPFVTNENKPDRSVKSLDTSAIPVVPDVIIGINRGSMPFLFELDGVYRDLITHKLVTHIVQLPVDDCILLKQVI